MSSTNQPTLTPIPTNVELYQLRNLATKQKIPSKVELKVISATGDKVAVLSKRRFWVFDTTSQVTLVCAGQFTNGKHAFQYALNDNKLETQHPIPNKYKISDFSCAALSTVYLAVGCPGRVMTFIVEGDQAGRWVTLNEFEDKDALIEKLTFSTDGKQLLALVRIETGNVTNLKHSYFRRTNSRRTNSSVNTIRSRPNQPLSKLNWKIGNCTVQEWLHSQVKAQWLLFVQITSNLLPGFNY